VRFSAISTNLAEIHHGNPIGDVLHHAQIMRDEQIGEAEFGLQVLQQIDDLRLHRNVQRRDRLVAYHEARLQRERPGNADTR
jgi:hypothetical protein